MELDIARLKELLDAGGVQLVDVREDYEFQSGHIPGATRIELPEVGAAADSFDRTRPLVFLCRTGNRSAMPAAAFREAGYDAYNLAGGTLAWHEQGLPLEPADGSVVERHQMK